MAASERLLGGDPRRFAKADGFIQRVIEGLTEQSEYKQWEKKAEKPFGTVSVKEMDMGDKDQIRDYLSFLWDPRNNLHFAHPPETVKDLIEESKNPRNHFLVATRVEKNNEGKLVERVVGGALLGDNISPENDHWIGLVVVDPRKQRQGIGEKLLRGIADWSYEHKTFEKRERDQLHLAINLGIDGWENMEKLVKKVGFKFFQTIGKEVDYWEVTDAFGVSHLEHVDLQERDKLEWKEVQREGVNATQAQRPDGSLIELVKKPTRRYLFRYVVDINKDHKSWEITPENWEEYIGSEFWNKGNKSA